MSGRPNSTFDRPSGFTYLRRVAGAGRLWFRWSLLGRVQAPGPIVLVSAASVAAPLIGGLFYSAARRGPSQTWSRHLGSGVAGARSAMDYEPMDALRLVHETLSALKHPNDFHAMARLPVTGRNGTVAYLRAVPAELKGEARSDARLMAEWRGLHRRAFFTWMTTTEQSTKRWLTECYGPSDEDIIFMIETPERTPFGHLALYHFEAGGAACEFGRVLRGPEAGPTGGMTLAARCLLLWAASTLGIRRVFLEVFKENQKAISLYERLGFIATETVPLRRVEAGETTRWEKITQGGGCGSGIDGYALRMEATADRLQALARG